MIPTPQQLEEVSHLRAGRMPEVPFAVLLLALAVHKRTVCLEVRRKQLAKKVSIELGVPVDCRSNLVHETLGRYLVASGKLPEEDLLPYLNQSAARGVRLGKVLLEHEVVTAEELFKLLQLNLAKKLLDVFAWKDGEWSIASEAPASDSPLKVRVPQLIVTGIVKCSPLAEVEAGVVPLVGRRLALNPDPPYPLDEIRLSPAHTQAAMALRSGRRMDEIAVGTGLPFGELNRLLYALAVLGLVVTADHLATPVAESMPVVQAPGGAAAAGERPAPEVAVASAAETGGAGPTPKVEVATKPFPWPGSADQTQAAPPLPAAAASGAAPQGAEPAVPQAVSTASTATAMNAASATRTATAMSAPSAASATRTATVMSAPSAASAATAATGASAAGAAGTARESRDSVEVAEERRNEIVQAYLSHRQQDAFDLLSVPETATLAAIEEAYLAFAERFAPWRLPGPRLEAIAEKARALFLAGARGFAELGNSEQRNTLLLRRETLREERRRRGPGDAFGIKTDLLDSEAQFRKGRALMEAGRYREALLQLEFASDCDPQNGLYSAELAYCRFLGSPGASGQALGELQETLRRDPDCGIALFYSGEIHRALGNHNEAETLLRRALKAMSPDRRPIQALKALAAERKR